MKKIFFLIFLFSISQIFSQNGIDTYFELSKKYRHPDSIEKYGRKILKLSVHNDEEKMKSQILGYQIVGFADYLRADYKKSIEKYDSALVYKKEGLKDHYGAIIFTLRNRAISNIRLGEIDKAKKQFKEILKLAKDHNDVNNIAKTYNNLGILEKNKSNFKEAVLFYKKAMAIWDSLKTEKNKSYLFLNIGIAQGGLNDLKQSNESFYKAIAISKKYKGLRDEYRAYNNLSVNYYTLKKYDSAIFYLHKTIPFYRARKIKRSENLAYKNLGKTYKELSEIDSAYYYLDKALKGFKEIKNPNGKYETYLSLADLSFIEKKYEQALSYGDSCVFLAKKMKNKLKLKNVYDLLGKSYEAIENYKQANIYFKLVKEIENNNFKVENTLALNKLLVGQNVKEQKEKITELTSMNSFYKSNLFIVLCLLIVLGVFSFFIFKNYKKGKNEIVSLQEELEINNSTYKEQSKIEESNFIHLKSKAVINTNEILYVKSDGHYVEIFIENKNKPEIERTTLTEMLNSLPTTDFIRTHKSYIVNIYKIKIINSTQLMLENGQWIKLSRTYKQQLKDLLNKK